MLGRNLKTKDQRHSSEVINWLVVTKEAAQSAVLSSPGRALAKDRTFGCLHAHGISLQKCCLKCTVPFTMVFLLHVLKTILH